MANRKKPLFPIEGQLTSYRAGIDPHCLGADNRLSEISC